MDSAVVTSTTTTTISLSWSTSACEGYDVQAALDSSFEGTVFSSSTQDAAVSALTVIGLSANTVYYVRAGNLYNGATNYASLGTVSTLTQPVSNPALTKVFYSSSAYSWDTLPEYPQPATSEGYRVSLSTAPDFSGVIFSSATGDVSRGALTVLRDTDGVNALTPNTSYYAEIGSLNWDGIANNVLLAAPTVTLSNPPVEKDYAVGENDLAVNWSTHSNPSDTVYLAQIAEAAGFAPVLASSYVYGGSALFSGLTANTTYYFRVSSFNRAGTREGPVVFKPVSTLTRPPLFADFAFVGASSASVNWGTNLNPEDTPYNVQISTAPDFSVLNASDSVTGGAKIFTPLNGNTTYYARVAGINRAGLQTAWTDLGLFLTYPAVPSDVSPSTANFSDVRLDMFYVNWKTNGNSTMTVYEVEISTRSGFSVLYASAATLGTSQLFSELPEGTTFYARVLARGQAGAGSDYKVLGSTMTLYYAAAATSYNETVTITLPTSYGNFVLVIPAHTFLSAVKVTLRKKYSFPDAPSPAAVLTPTGVGAEITTLPDVEAHNLLSLTIPYKTTDMAAFDRARLVIAYYDDSSEVWAPMPSTSNLSANTVTARVNHLSIYQIMQTAVAENLNEVKIFPNPFLPYKGHKFVQFTGLPAGAKVRIYTFLGELVREFKADSDGQATWDGFNSYGAKVASGVYMALFQKGSQKQILKLAVER